jgi:hypothetical protein
VVEYLRFCLAAWRLLFHQDLIRVFNETNPSGDVVNNQWYTSVLLIAVSVNIVVALKRFLVGLYLRRDTFGSKYY